MTNLTDQQLLRDFAGRRSDPAFAELVRRHVDLVYSAALRMVRDAHLAEDVTQAVFMALAQNARQLTDRPVLSGWLHRAAQNLAANTVRSEVRRRTREQEAALMNDVLSPAPDVAWEQIAPQLDAALGGLSEPDRDALLLRYFERKSAQEMAGILGISAEAAQKRVNRAVEKLRDYFSQRNVTVGAAGLTALLAANAVQAAPGVLADALSGAAGVVATIAHTPTLIAATKTIVMTTLQKTLATAAFAGFAVVAGASLYEARQAAHWRAQNVALQQQQTTVAALMRQLQTERDEASNRLSSLLAENQQRQTPPDRTELLMLRGEVGRLQQELKGAPSSRVALLKQKLEEMPDKKIPELKFLTEQNWIDASWNDLDTDDGVRLALSKLRDKAVDTFLNLTRPALKKYLAANNEILPADLLPLKPYYDTPVSDEMLRRYAFTQTGKLNPSDTIIKKAVYADPDYDSDQFISMHGGGGGGFNRFHDIIYNATMDFTIANNGQMPSDSGQLTPYLKRPVDPATMAKYFDEIRANIAGNLPTHEEVIIAQVAKAYEAANNGRGPQKPADLLPYATTAEQQAAIQSMGRK